jgi:hypothetical protein
MALPPLLDLPVAIAGAFSGFCWVRVWCRLKGREDGFGGGSAGQSGRAIVWRLRRDGVAVLALVRPTSDLAMLVVGDLRDPESLQKACQRCDAVVTTATSLTLRL